MAEDIAKQGTQALARPSFLPKGDTRGAENITKDDIQMPRLGIAQAQSPQVLDGNPKQIKDLKAGNIFNTLTGKVINLPVEFTVVRTERPRYIEFIPRTEGGGIRDYNVPAGDPRTEFTMRDGKSIPPVATKFYDFIVLLLPIDQNDPMSSVIALSLKSAGLKVARALNGMIKLRNAPSFAGKYRLSLKTETNSKGTWWQPVIENAEWVSEDEFALAGMIYESLSGKSISIEVDDDDPEGIPATEGAAVVEGDTAFDTSRM